MGGQGRQVHTTGTYLHTNEYAQVAKLVYALVLGTSGAIRGGSSPLLGTERVALKRRQQSAAQQSRRLLFGAVQVAR